MNLNLKSFSNSPLGIVIKVALVVLGGEFIIMLAIEFAFPLLFGSNLSSSFWRFMDPVLLTVIVAPTLYFSVLRPLNTQQLRLEQQQDDLKESEENFRSIVNQIIFGIVQSDLSGHITYANERYCEITGYSSEELVGKKWQDITHPEDLKGTVALYEQNTKIDKPFEAENRYIRKNGAILWVSIGASLRHESNTNQVGYTAIVKDITKRKMMEVEILTRQKKMEQLQKLHVSNQTASAIAHELNQPLLAISAYSRAAIMMFNSDKPDFAEICNALEANERQAQRAGKAIHDMLDSLMTKEFSTQSLDINKEIVDCINETKTEQNLRFDHILNLEKGLPLVRANSTHLKKILVNLLQNSADAMQGEGVQHPSIKVSTHALENGVGIQVTLQDNGPGIKRENFNRLFDPFFTTKSTGIGMGLAISRSLIGENGGQLWFDTQEGTGAVFHFTLPSAS